MKRLNTRKTKDSSWILGSCDPCWRPRAWGCVCLCWKWGGRVSERHFKRTGTKPRCSRPPPSGDWKEVEEGLTLAEGPADVYCSPCPKSSYLWDFSRRVLRATTTSFPDAHQTTSGCPSRLRAEGRAEHLAWSLQVPTGHTWANSWSSCFSVFSSIKQGHDSLLQVCGKH